MEGLEVRNKAEILGCGPKVYEGIRQDVSDEEWLKDSVIILEEGEDYKISANEKKLETDTRNVWV